MYYHVVADLETRFGSAEEALAAYRGIALAPRLPAHPLIGEENTTPRICVSPSLCGCITALSPYNMFKRCLGTDPEAFFYGNEHEAYPILVITFPPHTPVYQPSVDEVPDVERTGECWITEPTMPGDVQMYWLGSSSIDTDKDARVCTDVRFLTQNELEFKCHPWLNGRGSTLMSDAQVERERLDFEKSTLIKTIEEDPCAELLEARAECEVMMYDDDCAKYITFHLAPYSYLELLSKIHFGTSLNKVCNVGEASLVIAKALVELPKEVLMTLNNIFIVSTVEDMEMLINDLGIDEDMPENLYGDGDEGFLTGDVVGLCWFSQNSVIVNVHAIKVLTHEIWAGMEEYEPREMGIGFWTTLFHELRHQQMDCCPYEMAWTNESEASENAAEEWGRRAYERFAAAGIV